MKGGGIRDLRFPVGRQMCVCVTCLSLERLLLLFQTMKARITPLNGEMRSVGVSCSVTSVWRITSAAQRFNYPGGRYVVG